MRKYSLFLLLILVFFPACENKQKSEGDYLAQIIEEHTENNINDNDIILFTDEVYKRNAVINRTFKCYRYLDDKVSIRIELACGEETAKETTQTIIDLLDKTEKRFDFKRNNEYEILVIRSDTGIEDSFFSEETKEVIIPISTVNSGTYTGALYKAAFPEVKEFWIRQAIGCMMDIDKNNGQESIDIISLLQDTEIAGKLSLFGGYYYESLNRPETIKKLREVSAAFLFNIERDYGKQRLEELICETNENIDPLYTEWINKVNSENGILERKDSLLSDKMDFSSNEKYDIIILFENFDINIVWMPEEAKEITTSYELEEFINEQVSIIDEIRLFLKEQVALLNNVIDESYFHIVINEEERAHSDGAGVTTQEDRTITLGQRPGFSLPHELVHLFVGCIGEQWLGEGLAEYISITMFPEAYLYKGISDNEVQDIRYTSMCEIYEQEEKSELQKSAMEYWTTAGFNINDVDTFEYKVYYEGIVSALLQHYDIKELLDNTAFNNNSYYDIYYLFTDYLINRTSFSDVLEVLYKPELFRLKFGARFGEVRDEWVNNYVSTIK